MDVNKIKNDPQFVSTCEKYGLDSTTVDAAKNVLWMPSQKLGVVVYMDQEYNLVDEDVDIANHPVFKKKVQDLGAGPKDFYLFKDFIAVETPRKKDYANRNSANSDYCLMDRNFNIFLVQNFHTPSLIKWAQYYYDLYSTTTSFNNDFNALPAPFDELSLENIMMIASRIDGINSKDFRFHDRSKLFVGIDKKVYAVPTTDIYGCILALIKYLGISSDFYFDMMYPAILGGMVRRGYGETYGTSGDYLENLLKTLFEQTHEALKPEDGEGVKLFNDEHVDAMKFLNSVGQIKLISKVESFMPRVVDLVEKIYTGEIEISEVQTCIRNIVDKLGYDNKECRQKMGHTSLEHESLKDYFEDTPEKRFINMPLE